ncbi:hypothetical protein I4U23_014905 [Adineta vaga]|nr:hypothetical protein I4U23_014905 [Adineta vaga]
MSELNHTCAESTEHESSSAKSVVEYGPIRIRQCRKPAPTIATGRRSKHLVLSGDEAIKREQRREKNREAARKLKERRQLIEEELDQKLKELKGENSDLQDCLAKLQHKKQLLEEEINNIPVDPLDALLSNINKNTVLFFEQCSDNCDFLDESIEKTLLFDLNIHHDSTQRN